MENLPQKGAEVYQVKMEDETLFGKLLFTARNAGNLEKMSTQLGLNKRTLAQWESGVAFPEEEKLPLIAWVYKIKIEELKRVYKISKEAHKLVKEARKRPKPIKRFPGPDTDVYHGPGRAYRHSGHSRREKD